MLEDLFKIVKTRSAQTPKKPDSKVTIPSNLLFKCPRCGNVMFAEDFEAAKKVCAGCGYHARLTAQERLGVTVDQNSFEEYDADLISVNPLNFAEYDKKLDALRKTTGLKDAVITGECSIRGSRCAIGIMDSRFMMASMGSVVGEKIARLFERAAEKKTSGCHLYRKRRRQDARGNYLFDADGENIGCGCSSQCQGSFIHYGFNGPYHRRCYRVFASLGDIIIAEPKIVVGFAGRRVIEGTIHQHLPDDFQSAEFLLEHGFADMIVGRDKMRRTLSRLIRLHTKGGAR